jgi:hypothetical protein
VSLNRSLVANFVPAPPDIRILSLSANSHALEWPTNPTPCVLEETTDFASPNWTPVNAPVSVVGTNAHVEQVTQPGTKFYRLKLR